MKPFVTVACLSAVLLRVAAESPELEICRFPENKRAAAVLTFDDASIDQYTKAAPLLDKYGFRATFFAIVKRTKDAPNDRYMTWSQLKELASRGHEIGNHSMTHYQLTKAKDKEALQYEIVAPIKIFREKTGIVPQTFCYPGNARNKEIVALAESVHIGSTDCSRYFYGGDHFDPARQRKDLEQTSAGGGVHIAMIHGIVPGGGGWKPFKDIAVFEAVLKNFKEMQRDMWIGTFADYCKYSKLRDSATVERQTQDAFRIRCSDAYDFPLTVKISPCPLGAVQASRALNVIPAKDCGYVQVIPEKGPVTLRMP